MAGCPLSSGEMGMFGSAIPPEAYACIACIKSALHKREESIVAPEIPPDVLTGDYEDLTETMVYRISRPNRTAERRVTMTRLVGHVGTDPVIAREEQFDFDCIQQRTA